MAITEAWLKAKSGKEIDKVEEKADRDAMSVRVSTKGKIVYQLRYRWEGKPVRLDIGSYPLMSLKDARIESQRMRAMLEQGKNPKVERLVERQAVLEADTLESLFNKWYESYCIKNKKSHGEIKRSFELYVFPVVGKLPANRISLQQWLELLEGRAKETPYIAERILVNTKQMYKWAVKRKIVEDLVLSEIYAKDDLGVQKTSTDRVLSESEIMLVWHAVDKTRMAAKNKIFIKLCLIYGCRNGELRLAEKNHFDFDKMVWTVPPENHKTGKTSKKPILRPIIPIAEELLKEAMLLNNTKHLFTNDKDDNQMGASSPVQLPYNIMQWIRRHKGHDMPHWSVHDLRRTMRTQISDIAAPHIAEIMLGHTLPKIWQTYDRYDYMEEQREAYLKWSEKLMRLVGQAAS